MTFHQKQSKTLIIGQVELHLINIHRGIYKAIDVKVVKGTVLLTLLRMKVVKRTVPLTLDRS